MAFLHRPLLRKARRIGKTDETKIITVNVHLRRRPDHDPIPTFDDYVHKAPRVRLPENEFAQRFGAEPVDVAAIRAHYSRFGFSITHHMAARRVYLTGTVGQHNRAFHVDLHDYEFPHIHAHADAPHIPDHLAHVIMRLHGLHLVQFRPHILHGENIPHTGGLNPPGYNVALLTPQIVAGCYQFPAGHTGVGQAIGIFINYGEAPGGMDLVDATCTNYGIATPPTPVWLSVDGSPPPTTDTGDGWTQENVLDVTMCAMFAPGAALANIAIKNTDDYYVRLAHPHIGDPTFTVGSNSSGVSDEDVITSDSTAGTIFNNYDDTYQDCAIQGVTVCNSSGDWGNSADPWNLPTQLNQAPAPSNVVAGYPGDDPYVLDVGGTTLGPAAGGTIPTPTSLVEWVNGNAPTAPTAGETLSTASGGGVSIIYPVPSYQLSANIPAGLNTSQNPSFFGGTAGRGVPDICANWGMDINIGEGVGGFGDVGGTSMSCPIVASLIACVNSALGWNVGFINPILYSLNGNTSIIRRISPGGPPNNTVWSLDLQNPTAPVQIQNLPAYLSSSTAWSACGGLGVLLGQPFITYLQSVKNAATITGITLSNSTFPAGAPFGTVVGTISVATTAGGFAGQIAIGGGIEETGTVYTPGPDGQFFSLFGNNLVTIATALIPFPNGQTSFSMNLVAIQAGASNSPFVKAITVTISGSAPPPLPAVITINELAASFVSQAPAGFVAAGSSSLPPSAPAATETSAVSSSPSTIAITWTPG